LATPRAGAAWPQMTPTVTQLLSPSLSVPHESFSDITDAACSAKLARAFILKRNFCKLCGKERNLGKYTHILQESSFSVLESTQTGDTAGEGLEAQWGTVSARWEVKYEDEGTEETYNKEYE
jgi:hypothetical protein